MLVVTCWLVDNVGHCAFEPVVANTISLFSLQRDFVMPIPSYRMSYLTR
jgi:hypothetical protein